MAPADAGPPASAVPLPDTAATERYAARVADALPAGTLLLLTGPLGAGKTTFVTGLVRALGSDAAVSSPTYTLIHEYPTPRGTVVHVDAYRLPDPDALLELGLEDYLDRAHLVAVEWGGALAERFPGAFRLELDRSGESRRARLFAPEGTAVAADLDASDATEID